MRAIKYATGHGTGNDFVVIADEDASITLTADMARKLSDRAVGIGADGVLVVRRPNGQERLEGIDLVMGYRNSDGSPAEMCGNGIRVLVAYAQQLGWLDQRVGDSRPWSVKTPSGLIRVSQLSDGQYQVEMGKAQLGGEVTVQSNHGDLAATAVHVPNPHAVTFVPELNSLSVISQAPSFAPPNVFPDGANVEFVQRLGDTQARIIIYERGAGLTQSCGTGACAVAAVMATTSKERGQESKVSTGVYRIEVPGGVLSVIVDHDLTVKLIGPAEITGQGELAQEWWSANS